MTNQVMIRSGVAAPLFPYPAAQWRIAAAGKGRAQRVFGAVPAADPAALRLVDAPESSR